MIIVNIISDFIKIINSRLNYVLLFSIFLINAVFTGFLIGIYEEQVRDYKNVIYVQAEENKMSGSAAGAAGQQHSDIFGSSKGKYFYYKGCGGNNLSVKNLVYYKTEAEAIAKGKILYKGCE